MKKILVTPWEKKAGEYLIVVFLLVGGAMLIFRADLFSGSELMFKVFRDPHPSRGWYPWSRLALTVFGEGRFPLWNPYNFLGTPLLANYQSCVFSPLYWPLYFLPVDFFTVPYLFLRLSAAGVGTYLFCRRLGLAKSASLTSATAFGFTGYLVQYVNDIHIVIDLLIPFFLWAGENLAGRARVREFVLFFILSALVLLGGQPGAALFTLAFGYSYAAFRILCGEKKKTAGLFLLGTAASLSLALALPQIFPFLEFMSQGWTFHDPSFGSAHLCAAGLLPLISAGFLGPLETTQHHLPLLQVSPYLGLTVSALALAALLGRRRQNATAFFCLALICSFSILAGIPPLHAIVRLRGLDLLTFIKYLQPLFAFSAAVLAGRAVDELRAGTGFLRLSLSVFMLLPALLISRYIFADHFPELLPAMNGAVLLSLTLGAGLIIVSWSARFSRGRKKERLLVNHTEQAKGRRATIVIVGLVWLELVFASVVNHPLFIDDLEKKDFSVLRKITAQSPFSRLTAEPSVFLPNQGLLAPVFDFRSSDLFLVRSSVELFQAMTGLSEEEFFHNYIKYHALQVPRRPAWPELGRALGLRYFLTREPYPVNQTIDRVIQNGRLLAPAPNHLARITLTIGQNQRSALFAHPPLSLQIKRSDLGLPASPSSFPVSFAAGLDSHAEKLPGDGVWFMSLSEKNRPLLAWARYLDPRRQPGEQSWKKVELEVQEDDLRLITLPGKSAEHDWAAFGDLRAGSDDQPEPPARTVDGILVYEDAAGPRVYFARRVLEVTTKKEMIPAMRKLPDLEKAAVVERMGNIGGSLGRGEGDCRIIKYRTDRVVILTRNPKPELLILGDAWFPGWTAEVNGKETEILRTNHGLRGLVVPGGKNEVEFTYQPVAFRVGWWVGILSWAGIPLFLRTKARRSRP